MCLSSINLMLFYIFRCLFAILTPKWSKFDRFYKVFWSTFLDAPKCSRTNAFLTFRRVVKLNHFVLINIMLLIILEPFCDFDSKSLNFDRFYKVFWSTFLDAPKCSRTNAFLIFCKVAKRIQLLVKNLMPFLYFWWRFCENDSKRLHKRQVL